VIQVPHLSNFDDFDPLQEEAGVSLRYVASSHQLGNPDVVILPGSKTTMADLNWLRQHGLDRRILDLHRLGTFVIGICGGYQMLGQKILDPEKIESPAVEVDGLGLLPLTTVFTQDKETHQVEGEAVAAVGLLSGAKGSRIEGYEIHMGISYGLPALVPFSVTKRGQGHGHEPEGALDIDGRVMGTYIHGLFHNAGLRRVILRNIAIARGKCLPEGTSSRIRDAEYDKLAELVRRSLDMNLIYRIAGLTGASQNE
jgi:adenosylcobyric acid synthase